MFLILLCTIVYSLEVNYDKVKGEVIYNRTSNQTGWNFLQITLESLDDDEALFALAGRLEGEETREEIYNAYLNLVYGIQGGKHFLPKIIKEYVLNQYNWLKEQSKQDTPYWNVVKYLLIQLENMYKGYDYHYGKTEKALSFDQFYYLSNMGDLQDLWPSVGAEQTKNIGNCNTFYRQGIMGHTTFNVYQTMLRIYKSYNFKVKNPNFINQHISFTARPGDLQSKDDFIVIWDSQLVVTETSFNNFNRSNYEYYHYESVPCWIRVNVANRLAKTPQQWIDLFGQHRSGTHNSQWIVTDFASVVMGEEAFYYYKIHDLTDTLFKNQGYVASYNTPLDQEIFDALNYSKSISYDTDVRAKQFRAYQSNMTTARDIGRLLRFNKVTAEFDSCDGALCPRCDLNNGFTFGGIDGKVITSDMIKNKKVHLISSPTYQDHDPFNWKKYENVPHYGMTDEWRFPWYELEETNFTIKELYYDY